MRTISHAEALVEALCECMAEDPNVALVWGSIMGVGGNNEHAERIKTEFGDRIFHPPISEAIKAPVVFHVVHGLRGGGAVQHSQSPQAMLWNAPGIEIALPSCPADAKGLMRTAIKSDNPTVFIDHQKLTRRSGEVPEGPYDIPFGLADIKRDGRDVTIVAASLDVVHSLEAAEILAGEGIAAEIVDLRSLVPLDEDAILTSVAKTGRLVVVDECPPRCSVASEVISVVAEKGMDLLTAPPVRVNRLPVHVPSNRDLEDFVGPSTGRIAEAVRGVCG